MPCLRSTEVCTHFSPNKSHSRYSLCWSQSTCHCLARRNDLGDEFLDWRESKSKGSRFLSSEELARRHNSSKHWKQGSRSAIRKLTMQRQWFRVPFFHWSLPCQGFFSKSRISSPPWSWCRWLTTRQEGQKLQYIHLLGKDKSSEVFLRKARRIPRL